MPLQVSHIVILREVGNLRKLGRLVKRVVPFVNEKVNDCWISDRDRFSYEALGSNDRLTEPMIRSADGKLRVTSWEDAVNKAKELIFGSKKFNGLISSNSSLEEMALFGSMLHGLGDSNVDFRHWLNDEDFDKVRGDQKCESEFPWTRFHDFGSFSVELN